MSEQPVPAKLNDERVEGVIGNLLRFGVLLSAFVVLVGGASYLIRDGRKLAPDLHQFPNPPEEPPSLFHIIGASARGSSLDLIFLGLLLLIATPVARVIFSVAAFGLQRDYLYVSFTLVVLAVLLLSLFYGYFSDSGAL